VKSRPIDVGTTNAFYAPVIAGVSRACAELDVDLRLDSLAVDDQFDPVEVPRLIQAADVDGLIILGAYLSEPAAAMLGNQPVVLVDGYSAEPSRFPSILSDNAGGTATATRHLISLGHRRIAMAGTSPTSFPSLLDRRRGYSVSMREAGLEPLYVDGLHEDPEACAAAVSRALADDPAVTAVVAANDAVALAVLAQLRDRVPEEISVVGFDDIDAASLIRPRLDTVAVDKQAMGRMAVSMIRHRIANPSDPVFTVVQAAALVLRETSSATA
jgi:LacI family transcriptional regulator